MQQVSQQQLKVSKSEPKPVKHITDSKKNYETLFKIIYLAASIFSAILLRKIYLFQTMPDFEGIREGKVTQILHYALPFAIGFTIFDLVVHYLFDDLCEKYYLTQKKYQGKSRQKRAYTLVKWGYSIIYYLVSSASAYYLIKDTSFFPYWLGGKGACLNLVIPAPYIPQATEPMRIFYLFQLGKHFSRLFSHMFIKSQGNYYEYILHHSLSTFLIIFSYLTNQWLIGVMVLLCHDVSDILLIMARGYRDYKNYSKKVLNIIDFVGMVIWTGGRLIVFPACCVYSSLVFPGLVQSKLTDVQKDVLMFPYRWMGFMLAGLLFLQIFWTYYIVKGFISVYISQKIASNTYE